MNYRGSEDEGGKDLLKKIFRFNSDLSASAVFGYNITRTRDL